MKNNGFWRKLFPKQKTMETVNNNTNQKWMNSERCTNGHWYDNSVYDSCPYCVQDQGLKERMVVAARNRTEFLGNDGFNDYSLNNRNHITIPRRREEESDNSGIISFPKEGDLFAKKCPNCGSYLAVTSYPCVFGDDTGYKCLNCRFEAYYGGTRVIGDEAWHVVNEGESICDYESNCDNKRIVFPGME